MCTKIQTRHNKNMLKMILWKSWKSMKIVDYADFNHLIKKTRGYMSLLRHAEIKMLIRMSWELKYKNAVELLVYKCFAMIKSLSGN